MANFETEIHYNKDIAQKNELLNVLGDDCLTGISNKNNLSLYYRFLRKNLKKVLYFFKKDVFRDILFITIDKIPFDYITAFQKQYPDKKFKVLVPIFSIQELNKVVFEFDYFFRNRINRGVLYKLPINKYNIDVYGLYCEVNLDEKLTKFQQLVSFMKAVRICVKNLKPSIVHVDSIPFFLGEEFERTFPVNIKVFQVIKDLNAYDSNKLEPFWAIINMANKKQMKKICRDKVIKKNISRLFNLHNNRKFYPINDCLELIYENYSKFRKYIDKCEDIEENIIFNKLNYRILQLFPNLVAEKESFYNIFMHSIMKSNLWAIFSKTYFEEINYDYEKFGLLGKITNNRKNYGDYILYGFSPEKEKVYVNFDVNSFRENKPKNKAYLIKEFSKDRIRTNFVDISLFENTDYKISGYLDSFYSSPLFLIKLEDDIYGDGIDIALNVILKLFELNKNIQVVITSVNGTKNSYIKSWLDFVNKHQIALGRWVFVEGKIREAQFLASSDMVLLPKRYNTKTKEHYFAMSYGCIPVVSKIGIFNDTVIDIFDDISNGNGFKTKDNLTVNEDVNLIFYNTLNKALNLYNQSPTSWNSLIKNAMNYNSSWSFEIVEKYNEIYEKIM